MFAAFGALLVRWEGEKEQEEEQSVEDQVYNVLPDLIEEFPTACEFLGLTPG